MTAISLDQEEEKKKKNEDKIPAYPDVSKIPSLTSPLALRTLTYTRIKQLKKAASRPWNQPPEPPTPSDCCGSSCSPCVKDLWKEELSAWKERWGSNGIELGKDGRALQEIKQNEDAVDQNLQGKDQPLVNQNEIKKQMPGAYLDW